MYAMNIIQFIIFSSKNERNTHMYHDKVDATYFGSLYSVGLYVYTCNFMSNLLDVVDLCLYHMLYNGGVHSQGVAGDREGVGAD